MREVTTGDPFVMPMRMVDALDDDIRARIAAPMSKDDLWDSVEAISRLLGEASRRRLPADVYARLDLARAVALGMYSTAKDAS